MSHPEIERILPTALADWKIKQVEKCLGGFWKPDDVDYTELRALAGAEGRDVQARGGTPSSDGLK
ncbi:MAG: hypothetical protein ACE5NP_08345 [Anaerolineae bacterium]